MIRFWGYQLRWLRLQTLPDAPFASVASALKTAKECVLRWGKDVDCHGAETLLVGPLSPNTTSTVDDIRPCY